MLNVPIVCEVITHQNMTGCQLSIVNHTCVDNDTKYRHYHVNIFCQTGVKSICDCFREAKQRLYEGANSTSDVAVREARDLCQRLLDIIVKRKNKSPFDGDEQASKVL